MFENYLISTERNARRLVASPDAIGLAIFSTRHFKIVRPRSDSTE
jgi:uncharacterized membrane protein YeiH